MKLTISNAGKRYAGNFWALRSFSLELGPGVLGLLGPNGAGKSTLMRIVATVTKPTEGTVYWNKADIRHSPNDLRKVLGYLPQDFGIYPNLNAVEFLEYIAAIKGLDALNARKRISELLEALNLAGVWMRPLGGYSGGMRQRVGIAQALLNDPQVLIVDEPTAGLDPEERVYFRSLLSDLARERIIILSTHIVSDAEEAATQIVLINHGRLLRHASPEDLLSTVRDKVWEWVIPDADIPTLKQKHLVSSMSRRNDGMHIRVISEETPSTDAQRSVARLEDAYLYLISSDNAGGR